MAVVAVRILVLLANAPNLRRGGSGLGNDGSSTFEKLGRQLLLLVTNHLKMYI